jgi:hypothetical protein
MSAWNPLKPFEGLRETMMTRKQLQKGWEGLTVELMPGSPGFQFRYRVTGSIEDVAKWEKLLCTEYHPAGYGTQPMERPIFHNDGRMTVGWGHSQSCD